MNNVGYTQNGFIIINNYYQANMANNQYNRNYEGHTSYPNFHQNTSYGAPTNVQNTQSYPNYEAQNYTNYHQIPNCNASTNLMNAHSYPNWHHRTNYESVTNVPNVSSYANYQQRTNYEVDSRQTTQYQYTQQTANPNCNQIMSRDIPQMQQPTVVVQLNKKPESFDGVVDSLLEYPPSTEEICNTGNNMLNQSEIFYCTTCNISFTSSIFLERHFNAEKHKRAIIESDAHPNPDNIQQLNKDSVQQPNETISDASEHTCMQCDRVFTKASYLYQHIEAIHIEADKKPYKCQHCNKRYSSKQPYQRHLLRHALKKCFKCDQCPKEFKSNNDLVRHKYCHGGTKPHSCEICGKSFIRRDQMLTHVKYHGGYPCRICGKLFQRRYDMITHRKTH